VRHDAAAKRAADMSAELRNIRTVQYEYKYSGRTVHFMWLSPVANVKLQLLCTGSCLLPATLHAAIHEVRLSPKVEYLRAVAWLVVARRL
jgi:hypothetical protein